MGGIGVTLPEYVRRKPSGFYWEPSRRVRALGFVAEALGTDAIEAVRKARDLNRKVAVALKTEGAESAAAVPGTLAWAAAEYQKSEGWERLADSTRRGYRQGIERLELWAGDKPVERITRKAVKAWYREMATRAPAFAAATVRVLRVVLHFAKDEGHEIASLDKLRLHTAGGDGEPWEGYEVSAYVDEATRQGRASMALALMLGVGLGQREGDILRLPRAAHDRIDGTISLKQRKTGRVIKVPVLPELLREIDTAPKLGTIFVISERTGKPYGVDHFRHTHRKICRAAGIPDKRKFMHLRHTAATRLGEAGCSDDLIRAVTGHKDRGTVGRYVTPNDTMARAAITRLIEHRRKVEP
jgi:integrase